MGVTFGELFFVYRKRMIQTTFCGNFWWLFNAKSGLYVWNVDVFACFPFCWLVFLDLDCFSRSHQNQINQIRWGWPLARVARNIQPEETQYGLLMFGWPQSSWWKTSIIFCSFWWFLFIVFLNFTLLPHYLSLFGDLIKSSGYCNPLLGDWNQFLPMKLISSRWFPLQNFDLTASFLMAFDH